MGIPIEYSKKEFVILHIGNNDNIQRYKKKSHGRMCAGKNPVFASPETPLVYADVAENYGLMGIGDLFALSGFAHCSG
jgi:hypothetical protein